MVGIYAITNTVNGKVYIGQSTNVKDRIAHHKSRLRNNRHENDYLQNSWNKYGEECFEFSVLAECSEDELDIMEKQFIQQYDSMNRDKGYNRESGGSINKHMSEEVRKKMSESAIGKHCGEKNPMYGVHLKCSEEKKRKLSEMFKGKKCPQCARKSLYTPEELKRLSEKMTGKGNPFYGKKHTEESRQKMSERKRKVAVRCVETGEEYISGTDAMRKTGIHSGSIFRAARNHLTAGGYHWELVA